MNNGIVKWFNNERGYGFIAKEDGTEIFVHQSNILMKGFRTLEEGKRVTFDIDDTSEKVSAINVNPE